MEILGFEPKASCLQSKRATNCAKFTGFLPPHIVRSTASIASRAAPCHAKPCHAFGKASASPFGKARQVLRPKVQAKL